MQSSRRHRFRRFPRGSHERPVTGGGGVRSVVPVHGAIAAGAQLVFAISASAGTLVDPDAGRARSLVGELEADAYRFFGRSAWGMFSTTWENWSQASLVDIGFRAMDMLPHSIQQLELD